MPTPSFDSIVIGGGVNGLACAGRLALAGKRVLVVEGAAQPGGGAATAEFAPGYRVDGLAHLVSHLDDRMLAALRPERHGLAWAAPELSTTALDPTGRHLTLHGAYGAQVDGLAPEEAARWARLRAELLAHAGVLAPLRQITPPLPGRGGARGNLRALARLGLDLKRLGREGMREFLRLVLINIHDLAEERLTDDRLRGLLAFDATLGAFMGPRSPGSLFLMWHRLAGDGGRLRWPRGGMGALAAALAAAVRAAGAEVRLQAPVAAILHDGARVTGVRLTSGEEIAARRVIAAINPRTAMLDLLGAPALETETVRRLSHVRMRGTAARLHLALKGRPDFRGADLRHRLVIAPSSDTVETAFNPVKYGRFSPAPVLEILCPSAHDPAFAPAGHHVLSVTAQFAPHDLHGGWAAGRGAFEAAILAQLEAHAPGLRDLIVATDLLTPPDIAARYGMVGGSWHHGDLSVDRMLFLRPAIGLARYATPMPGLWLAGAGSHPGGGISGTAGWNAAGEILGAQ